MRHASGQLADALELLRLPELLFQHHALRDILQEEQGVGLVRQCHELHVHQHLVKRPRLVAHISLLVAHRLIPQRPSNRWSASAGSAYMNSSFADLPYNSSWVQPANWVMLPFTSTNRRSGSD